MSDNATGAEIAVGRIPSGVAILTASHEQRRTGMLASWIQQASFEPLRITVAVKSGRPIEELIDQSRGFVVNMLASDDTDSMKHFGKGFGPDDDAFNGVDITDGEQGPTLTRALAVIECRLSDAMTAGDHRILLGEVVGGRGNADGQPFVHLRKSGLHY